MLIPISIYIKYINTFTYQLKIKSEFASRTRDRPSSGSGLGEDFDNELDTFFTPGPLPADFEPAETESVLLRVGAPEIEVGGRPLMEVLTPLYQQLLRGD